MRKVTSSSGEVAFLFFFCLKEFGASYVNRISQCILNEFFSLKGKTAIVTGGNSGLGQAFAMALAKAGANLFIPSFVKDNGETKEIIEKQGVEVEFMQVDITEKGAPQKIIAACCERFGTVDILVNNAGICKLNKVLDFGRADWDPMIDVNLTAAFELSYEAAKL